MKRFWLLFAFISMVLWMGVNLAVSAQVLLEENFDYTAGDLITAHGWTAHSGGGSQPITVSTGGLTYTGYPGSGVGNAALLDNTGEDDNTGFAVQSAGTVYVSFMVNVTATAAGYFFHLGGSPIGTTYRGKIFLDATNHFGVSVGSNTGTFAPAAYTLGTTYVLVLKYEIVSGTNNDIVSLFVFDGAIPAGEPTIPTIGPLTDASQADINPGSLALRQFSSTQNLLVDGIRTGLSWTDILPPAISPPTLQAQDITFSAISTSGMTTAWTNGNGSKRIAVINTANSFTNPIDGTDPAANPVYSGSGEQVIHNGAGNSVAVSGLSGGTTYWYRVYEYNGTGASTRYLTATAPLNPNSQATQAVTSAPVIGLPVAASVSSNSAVLGATISGDGGSPILERGTLWSLLPGVTITDNKLAEGGTTTGIYNHLRSGMPVKSLIYFKGFATNAIGTSLTSEAQFYTLAAEPLAHVTGFAAASTGNTSIQLTWTTTSTGADGYLILMRSGPVAPSGIPADGTGYTEGTSLGDGTIVAVFGPGSALSRPVTGLSPGTQYSFTIIPYAWDGINTETYNYLTSPVIPSAQATTTGSASATYTWQGPDNGLWTTAANWNPSRTSPAASDVLQFNGGGTKTITGVVTQTIARFIMSNNTTLNLQSASASTLTISGASGNDLEVPAGCSLNLNAVNAITVNVGTTANALIQGSMRFSSTSSTAHRLTGADPGSILFAGGSVFTAGTFFSGNPFGTSSLNSVVFASGSTYLQQAGSNPFGAGQPNSVVVFQPGSLFKVMANLAPSFSGRTYADFELDAPGVTLSTTGSNPVSMDHLTITNGTLNFNMTGPASGMHQIKGNITVQAGGFLNFNPSSAAVISLTGTGIQSVTSTGSLTFNANTTLDVNGSEISLNSSLTLPGNLKLTQGFLNLGSNDLVLGSSSVITGSPSELAMIVAAGSGQLKKGFPSGFAGSFTFPVGDNNGTAEYSPLTLNFTGGTFATGNFAGVSLANAKFPGDPNTTSFLNRYWNFNPSGITSFSCDIVCQYVPADVSGTEQELFNMRVVPLPFTDYGLVNSGLHQLTFPAVSSAGTFTGSQPRPSVITLAANTIGANTATLHGEVIANYNTTAVEFEYGPTTAYGTVVQAFPASVTGGGTNTVLANIIGLTQNTLYHFRIKGTNVQGTSYGNDLTFTTTCPAPSAAGAITGPATVCPNGSGYVYTVAPVPNATGYTWTLPPGGTITSGAGTNSITVSFGGSAASGNVTVLGTSVCGSGAVSPSYPVTVEALPVPVVTGPSVACIQSMGNSYQTQTGMTGYTWSVSAGGTITSGQNTESISVTWTTAGAQSVSVNYTNATGCTGASPTVFPVNVTPLPVPTISGPSTVCANAANIVYSTEPGMTNYNWAVSIGGTIISGAGTNAITVLWPYPGNRSVSVTYATPTGCLASSPTVFPVTIQPAAVPVIGSSGEPCINSTIQYITNSGMLSYMWAVSPGGTLLSGQGTNTIEVQWNASGVQWVSVSFTNTYGCAAVSPTVYNLLVNPLPNAAGAITGTSILCAGTSGVSYSCSEILNATGYDWQLPPGATIASGAGTRSIIVNFSAQSVSGAITVAGSNSCGNGASSPPFDITVHPIPPAPVVSLSGNTLSSNAPAGNQWYREGFGAIAGATGSTYQATQTGWYWTVVTLNGCTSPPSNYVYVLITALPDPAAEAFNVYPVPSDGKFRIALPEKISGSVTLHVYTMQGTLLYRAELPHAGNSGETEADLFHLAPGVYTLVLRSELWQGVRKIVISR